MGVTYPDKLKMPPLRCVHLFFFSPIVLNLTRMSGETHPGQQSWVFFWVCLWHGNQSIFHTYGKAEHHLFWTTLKKPLIPSEGVSGGGSPFLGEVYMHEVEPCSPSDCVWLKTIGRHPITKFMIPNRYTKFGSNSHMSKVHPKFYNLFVSHFVDHVAIQLVFFVFSVNMCFLQF